MAKGLTKRQQSILEYIVDYVQREGYPPSIREIGKDFNIGSLRGVTVHLDALDRKGYINRSNTPRSIKVIHPQFQATTGITMLPLMGTAIAAGTGVALEDEYVEDQIAVPNAIIGRAQNAFLLRINGDSMIGDGIMDRDLVVIRPQEDAKQNELVAVAFDGVATVKRMNYAKDGIYLMPSNPAYEPIRVGEDGARVVGKVIGLMRMY
jgi:repressor LexA